MRRKRPLIEWKQWDSPDATGAGEALRVIDKELLDILACPACKAPVELIDDKVVCTKCGRRYRISEEKIPVMLVDEAEPPK
ncbi:MAG TPA: Trm112 family protein [Planctomycetota bacterium]|nr:Trm112 family protein [Planctomycetota bacterium]